MDEGLRALESERRGRTIAAPGGRPGDRYDAEVVTDPAYQAARPVELGEMDETAEEPIDGLEVWWRRGAAGRRSRWVDRCAPPPSAKDV